jgi:hypothetical protein
LRAGDDIFVRDLIATGDGARAEIVLGGKVVVAIGERSRFTISEIPGRAVLFLETGQLAISVEARRIRQGESIDVRTSNAIAIVRGDARLTVQVVPPMSAGGPLVTHVDVVDGSASVVMPGPPASPAIALRASDGITITGQVVGPVRGLRTVQ